MGCINVTLLIFAGTLVPNYAQPCLCPQLGSSNLSFPTVVPGLRLWPLPASAKSGSRSLLKRSPELCDGSTGNDDRKKARHDQLKRPGGVCSTARRLSWQSHNLAISQSHNLTNAARAVIVTLREDFPGNLTISQTPPGR